QDRVPAGERHPQGRAQIQETDFGHKGRTRECRTCRPLIRAEVGFRKTGLSAQVTWDPPRSTLDLYGSKAHRSKPQRSNLHRSRLS
ncbi:hypothetical protein MPH_14144, partial [Macrophomina phaseolina MS6]